MVARFFNICFPFSTHKKKNLLCVHCSNPSTISSLSLLRLPDDDLLCCSVSLDFSGFFFPKIDIFFLSAFSAAAAEAAAAAAPVKGTLPLRVQNFKTKGKKTFNQFLAFLICFARALAFHSW